jgi:hypothetical protein
MILLSEIVVNGLGKGSFAGWHDLATGHVTVSP